MKVDRDEVIRLRKSIGWSRRRLGREAKLSYSTLWTLETGSSRSSEQRELTAFKIAAALDRGRRELGHAGVEVADIDADTDEIAA